MKTTTLKAILLATAASLSSVARADTIIDQSVVSGGFVIQYYQPVGQSFTAIGTNLVSFDFFLQTWDNQVANHSLTIDILQGSGTGGAVLASSSFNLANGHFGMAGTTFNLDVVLGAQYTAVISTDTWYWGLGASPSDVYAGGQLFDGNGLNWGETAFRATFNEGTNVPESGSTMVLMAGAFVVMAISRRRSAA